MLLFTQCRAGFARHMIPCRQQLVERVDAAVQSRMHLPLEPSRSKTVASAVVTVNLKLLQYDT